MAPIIYGEVLDVAVDIRQGSPTFGQYVSERLNSENKHQLFIPRGFAHGFLVLSDFAIFSYKVDNFYSSLSEEGLAFDDPTLGINWGLSKDQLNISDKDLRHPLLEKLKNICLQFSYKKNLYE